MVDGPSSPRFHPRDEFLVDYATGAAPAALALIVASHAQACSACRNEIRLLEALGGTLIETIEPAPLAELAWNRMLEEIGEPMPEPEPVSMRQLGNDRLPGSLRHIVKGCGSGLRWRRFDGLFEEALLQGPSHGHRVSLIRASKGGYVPHHDHEGDEHMLVLQGGLTIGGTNYRTGDYAFAAAGEAHEPIAYTEEECLCLLVLAGSLQFDDRYATAFNEYFMFKS